MTAVDPHLRAIRTTCAYCGVGCGVLATPDGKGGAAISGDPGHPANFGRLCSKGSALGETLGLENRLLHPMIRCGKGTMERVAWSDALEAQLGTARTLTTDTVLRAYRLYLAGSAMSFERGTLEAVIAARNQAIGLLRGGGGAVPSGAEVRQLAAAENQLSGALGKLFAVVEAYPQLKATGNVTTLQEELTSTENKIAFARQLYNDQATNYNTAQQQFPTNMVAGVAGASPAELWEIADAAEREVPKVNLAAT